MLWLTLSQALALPLDAKHCATLSQLQFAPPPIDPADVPQHKQAGKQERDAVCNCPNSLSSSNFVVKWGSGVTNSQAQDILSAFEYAWQIEVEQMGYLAPTSTDQYLFNVYVGDSDSGTPDGYGAAGYFTLDNAQYPMIVLAKDTVSSDYLATTIAHEFFHALQGRVMRYNYDETGPSAWYWEATANWAEGNVYPGEGNMAGFLIGYNFFPHYPVNYFNYPDSGTLDEYHQYGAFIFPLHLTEVEANTDLIWNSWNDTSSENDPMVVLDQYLSDYGTDINEAWLHHIARMTVMDYEQGDTYSYYLDYYQDYYPEGENRIAATVMQQGTNGWRAGPADLMPMRYGHNAIEIKNLSGNSVSFGVRGDSQGTMGSSAHYGATVTRVQNGQISYHPLSFSGQEGSLTLDNVSSSDLYYLTVGAWTDSWNSSRAYSEKFYYQYLVGTEEELSEPSAEPSSEPSVEPSVEPDSDPSSGFFEDSPKASCATANQSSWWGIVFVTVFGLGRRRK